MCELVVKAGQLLELNWFTNNAFIFQLIGKYFKSFIDDTLDPKVNLRNGPLIPRFRNWMSDVYTSPNSP